MQFVEQRYDNTFLGDLIYAPHALALVLHTSFKIFKQLFNSLLENKLSSATFALLKYRVFVIVL